MKFLISLLFVTVFLPVNTLTAMHTNTPWRNQTPYPSRAFANLLTSGNLKAALAMVKNGTLDKDINSAVDLIHHKTPLILTISYRAKPNHEICDTIVEALIKRPTIDINKPDASGTTPLMYAALTAGGDYIFSLLFNRLEIDVNAENNDGDLTLLSVMIGVCNGLIDKKTLTSFITDSRVKITYEDLQLLVNYAIVLDFEYIEQLLNERVIH